MPGQTLESTWPDTPSRRDRSFNGGPGNCPAKPTAISARIGAAIVITLQWRAGQLPGQTVTRSPLTGAAFTFNGGPGNCPAKP